MPLFTHLEKLNKAEHLKFVDFHLCQSSPSSTILVHFWFIIISLVFTYLGKLPFH